MSKKSRRVSVMRTLICSEVISSQKELLCRLNQLGVEATQSTLSRDMKELKIVKVPHVEKGYAYIMPNGSGTENPLGRVSAVITDNLLWVDFSHPIGILKTKAGFANAIAILIENENFDEIVGIIAGDDTVMVILQERATGEDLLRILSCVHPGIRSLYRPASSRKASLTLKRDVSE